jgi:hypothetical protein
MYSLQLQNNFVIFESLFIIFLCMNNSKCPTFVKKLNNKNKCYEKRSNVYEKAFHVFSDCNARMYTVHL